MKLGWTGFAIAMFVVAVDATPQREIPAEGRPTFEAATIKLAPPDAIRNRVMPTGPNRLHIPSMSLGGISLDGATMFTVAEVLSLPQSRPLLGDITADRTGLTGRYTMELDFTFPVQGPGTAGATSEFARPSLSTAIREQWGLRPTRGPAPFRRVVIEHATMPDSN